jgi:leucyl-tRNA synthetase
VRLFSLFAAPPEKELEWSDQGVEGASRFLYRIFRFVMSNLETIKHAPTGFDPENLNEPGRALHRKTHQTIRKVGTDIETRFHFNTAISALMELTNQLFILTGEEVGEQAEPAVVREAVEALLLLLSPMTPHLCEELWQAIGHTATLARQPWPEFNEESAREDEITIVLQVNGKVRSRLLVAPGTSEGSLKEQALADGNVGKFTTGKTVRKVIVVPNKLINIVVS